MANYANLKAAINDVIKANGVGAITGTLLNQVLIAMVNSLGSGYQFMGLATPSTNPGTPDQNVFYFATQAGVYTNFDAIILQAGISVLMWDGDWASQTWFTIDSTPTNNSQSLIFSGAVFNALKLDGGAYDVTAHNSDATFASLSELLNSANLNTLIPTEIRHGGMSIKFVQSSDNKYVQYRLILSTFNAAQFTNTANWQGVDYEPVDGSKNLVESGGVVKAINERVGGIVTGSANTSTYIMVNVNIKSGDKFTYKVDIPTGTTRVILLYNGSSSKRIADTDSSVTPLLNGVETEYTATEDITSFGLWMNGATGDVTLTIKYGIYYQLDYRPVKVLANGVVDTANLKDNSVSTDKIKGGAITQAKLATNSVGNGQIANNAVSRDKILNNAVDNTKIAVNTILLSNLRNFINISSKILPLQSNGIGIFESRNKNIVSRIYASCFFNEAVFSLQINDSYDVLFCAVKPSTHYICNATIRFISFLNEDGELQTASQTNNQFDTIAGTAYAVISVYATTAKKYQVEEGTSSTTYVAYSPIIGEEFLPSTNPDKIFISTTDTQFEILTKMLEAFNLGNCDVIWEKGTYTFDDVYVYMRYTLGWNWTMELPIGKGCRYFFNGSTLIANYPDDTYRAEHYPWASPYDQPVNILGVKAGGMGNTNFEIHDAHLVNNGGTYCVHDECVSETTGYNHVYDNCIMEYNQGGNTEALSKCIGGGAGRNGNIIIKNCVFVNNNTNTGTEDVSWHGIQSPESAADVSKLIFMVDGCYFSRKFRVGGSFKTGDSNSLKYSNNSHTAAPTVEQLTVSYIFNNELRN